MAFGDLTSESSGVSLLLSLPEDVFAVISRFLSPRDICNLSFCCKSLFDLVDSEKIWLAQCEVVEVVPLFELVQWRLGISSYKSLCRFLVKVKPLIGIWVHQNPELGNVIYVMPSFLSVIGCRIIPQEVGPLGILEGQVRWSPVFEIICDLDGSTRFFLHGKERECSCLYPGFVMEIDKSCNMLLLEVEPRRERMCEQLLCSENETSVPFCKLAFSDRRKLLDVVTSHVRLQINDPLCGMLFPKSKDDIPEMLKRRTMLLKMNKFGGNWNHMNLEDELCYDPMQVDINEIWKDLGDGNDFRKFNYMENQMESSRKSFSGYFKNGIKHILGKSNSTNNKTGTSKNTSSSSEIKRWNLQRFLSSGDTVSLSLKASNTKLSSYRGWPNMHDNRFALYKLPITKPDENQAYTGLWGGTFGWPPGKCTEDKPGKALFLLLLTYEESQKGEKLLIGTKILEGTNYVMHPNGSAMFVVKIDKSSFEPFPFDTSQDGENSHLFAEHCYTGEGIANGYGFRYPGSKPGSLFVTSNGLLVFVWNETKAVLTLQRLELEDVLKKGLCVSPLPPLMNFTYLTKSYTNVFAGFANSSAYSSSLRPT